MNEIVKSTSNQETVEKKLLELMQIQLKIVEQLYADVHAHIKQSSTSSNNIKIIKNVPILKMNINSSRQKIVVQMKAGINQYQKQLEQKYGKKE